MSEGFPLASPGWEMEQPRSLYIHVPFCSSKCSYCDFHSIPMRFSCDEASWAHEADIGYVDMLVPWIDAMVAATQAAVETLYVGGGTPTVLGDRAFVSLLEGLSWRFGSSVKEWTVEANPESLSDAKLKAMLDAGVTRVSIGVQSLDEAELGILGRRGGPAASLSAVERAAAAGLSVSADLIAALPLRGGAAPRHGGLAADSGRLADAGVGHISIYDLVVEEGTPLTERMRTGLYLPADSDAAEDDRKSAETLLASRGFLRYEVSNYALPGKASAHNGAYWRSLSYLGAGSGAVSTLHRLPCAERPEPGEVVALRVESGRDIEAFMSDPSGSCSTERIDAADAAFEMIMMGLRTSEGVDLDRFSRRFQRDAQNLIPRTIERWNDRFTLTDARMSLDGRGLDLLNLILVDALGELEDTFA